jgi:hypothetical protein
MKSSMKPTLILSVTIAALAPVLSLHAQVSPAPATTTAPVPSGAFEPRPTLSAAAILQPQYLSGANFTVRDAVPTYAGSNQYTIDSDFGVFTAAGSQMLMRRVAEIKGIAQLQAYSKTDEFTQAAAQAAVKPLGVAQDLVTDPVQTISSVPRGIFGFLKGAGETVKRATEGDGGGLGKGQAVSNMSGFSKTKRDLALKMNVDPYTTNETFQRELSKVAWPAFLGKMTVNLGMAAVTGGAGTALSVVNWTGTLQDSLRDKSPTDLRVANQALLVDSMGVSRADADEFLNNSAISPTTQTIIVSSLAQLGNIPGQADFIRQAASSESEQDALGYQLSVQIMAKLNATAPIARITHLSGLTVCQTNDGTVVVPIQWDYVAWTPGASQFITALKAQKFSNAPTAYTVMINGTASPMATQALAGLGVNLVTKAIAGPLQ